MSRARSVADLGNQSLNLSVSDGALKVGAGATVENTGESQFAGIVTATKFVGDGSGLTGVTGTGSGVVVKNSGSPVGTAATIDFGANLSVSAVSAGIVTITGGAGGGDTVSIESSATDILSVSSGAISADDAGADKLVFWDDSAGKLTYLTVGSNLTVTDTTIAASGSGGSGISNVVEDTTPQLGGDLDINGKNITGTGNVNLTGISTFGSTTLSSLSVGSALDITSTNSASTIQANNSSQPFYIQGLNNNLISILAGTGSQGRVTVYNQGKVELAHAGNVKFETTSTGAVVTGILTATSFSGDGSALTGVTASGTGVVIKHDGSVVGTAATINFGTNLDVSALSAGIVTVTAAAGTIAGINTSGTTELNNLTVAGIATFPNNIDANGNLNLAGEFQLSGGIAASGSSDNLNWGSGNFYFNSGNPELGWVSGDAKLVVRAGSSTYGNTFSIQGRNARDNMAVFTTGGGADLYYNDVKKFETTSTGAVVTGILTATSFSGDGSALTGVVTSIVAGSNITLTGGPAGIVTIASSGVSDVVDDTTPQLGGNLDLNGKNIIGTGNVNLTGVITATSANFTGNVSVGGTLTYEDVTNIDSIGIVTARTGIKVLAGGADISGVVTATTFSGSGASLTSIPAGQLTGTVADARLTTVSSSKLSGALPAISGASLTNLPAPTPADTDVQVTYDISSNGSSAYRITGPGYSGADDNPDIYLIRGQRYRFINGTGSGHPFRIQSDTSGTAYTDGVTGSRSGTQDFNVQYDAPVRLYYQCTIHGGMIGNIYIVGGSDWRMTDVNTSTAPEIYTTRSVGIGTDNPGYKLHVTGGAIDLNSSSTAFGDGVRVGKNIIGYSGQKLTISSQSDGIFLEGTSNSLIDLSSSGISFGNSSSGEIKFYPNTWTISNNPTITGSLNFASNIGIGTDNPTTTLHIKSTNTSGDLTIERVGNNANGPELVLRHISETPADNDYIGQITFSGRDDANNNTTVARIDGLMTDVTNESEDGELVFNTRSNGTFSEKLRISSNGELVNTFNIGDSAEAVGLFINNTSAQTGNIAAVSFSTDSGNRKKAAVGLTQMDSNGSGHLVFCVDGADTGSVHMVADEKLRITNAGYVGVKNSFPLVSLDLSETTDAIALPTGTTAQRPSGTDAYIRKNSTNNALEFYNGTEWVEIITDYFPTGSTILG